MAKIPASEHGAAESGRRLVRRNHAVRTAAYAYCFLVVGLIGWERQFGPPFWVALAASYLVLPHVLAMHALGSRDPRQGETRNIFADAVLFGLWTAALHFPTWIAYAAVASVTLNAIVARGVLGALVSFSLFSAGAALWVAVFGFERWPLTSDLVSALCFFGALGYTLSVGMVVNVQWRRLMSARDDLRAGEARYRLITEHAADLIAIVDQDARWLYSSPSYERLLDDADLQPGADAFRRMHPQDADRARAAVLRAAAAGADQVLSVRLTDRAGRARDYRMRVHRLEAESGLKARLLLVSQASPGGGGEALAIVGADGLVEAVNEAYTRLTGYAPEEAIGRAEGGLLDVGSARLVLRRRKDGESYRAWRSVRALRDAAGGKLYVIALAPENAGLSLPSGGE
jgi:PAS domain S-box-containing protein